MIDRYTHPDMGNIWTLENEFRTMLKVEILACEAMNKLGVVPDEALKDIQTKSDFRLERIKEIEDHEGETIASEGIDSNYMDIINYSVFGVIKLGVRQ